MKISFLPLRQHRKRLPPLIFSYLSVSCFIPRDRSFLRTVTHSSFENFPQPQSFPAHSCIFRKRLYDNSASTGEVPCTPHKNVQFPSPDHCMEGGRYLLASSHAGTRLPIADLIHGPGRSPSARRLLADPVSSFPKVWFLLLFFCHLFRKHNDPELFKSDDIKTGDTHRGMSPVKIHIMTSYGGIIRIRLKGRSSITSSQPANELPCFL